MNDNVEEDIYSDYYYDQEDGEDGCKYYEDNYGKGGIQEKTAAERKMDRSINTRNRVAILSGEGNDNDVPNLEVLEDEVEEVYAEN